MMRERHYMNNIRAQARSNACNVEMNACNVEMMVVCAGRFVANQYGPRETLLDPAGSHLQG